MVAILKGDLNEALYKNFSPYGITLSVDRIYKGDYYDIFVDRLKKF